MRRRSKIEHFRSLRRSERKCLIFDLLWPDSSIPEGKSEKFVFLEN